MRFSVNLPNFGDSADSADSRNVNTLDTAADCDGTTPCTDGTRDDFGNPLWMRVTAPP
ncbi:hypothetical protein O7599_26830 [Streptomyces sp. WMMC500]|uniref:hypothetical protein n=1 Tax=Streptomyces sp. WMMC500 TaxID=3015154 RepID=UPI00248ACE7F|nr:hypothetical protein [Streptomyces sp. WMMC500]WBB59174.1 hypothetical protein O7599_26830 [Streptomyces sp. WMMC500]